MITVTASISTNSAERPSLPGQDQSAPTPMEPPSYKIQACCIFWINLKERGPYHPAITELA